MVAARIDVIRHAATFAHAPIARVADQDHLTIGGTASVKCFSLAEIFANSPAAQQKNH